MTPPRRVSGHKCACCRVHRKAMKEMSALLVQALNALDAEMKKPSDHERGKRIASIANAIDIQRQVMERFTLNGFECASRRVVPSTTQGKS